MALMFDVFPITGRYAGQSSVWPPAVMGAVHDVFSLLSTCIGGAITEGVPGASFWGIGA